MASSPGSVLCMEENVHTWSLPHHLHTHTLNKWHFGLAPSDLPKHFTHGLYFHCRSQERTCGRHLLSGSQGGWKRIELRAGLSHQPASHKGSNDLTLGGGTWKEAIASAAL